MTNILRVAAAGCRCRSSAPRCFFKEKRESATTARNSIKKPARKWISQTPSITESTCTLHTQVRNHSRLCGGTLAAARSLTRSHSAHARDALPMEARRDVYCPLPKRAHHC